MSRISTEDDEFGAKSRLDMTQDSAVVNVTLSVQLAAHCGLFVRCAIAAVAGARGLLVVVPGLYQPQRPVREQLLLCLPPPPLFQARIGTLSGPFD